MATYVISDIHGEYGKFMELLDIIHFSDEDILYVLGDVVDRGKNPVKTLLKMMEMPNVIPIAGNHEQMMLECMSVLINEVKDENSIKEFAEKFSDDMFQKLYAWQRNGGIATTDELSKLDNEQKYLLVHGGLGNFDIKRDIDDYSLDELVWSRVDYDVRYFDDVITVTGHTPTRYIEDNPRPGYVYRKNNHIDIDCGAYLPGGRLAAICLDTGEEFYSGGNDKD